MSTSQQEFEEIVWTPATMCWVELQRPDAFLIIAETLTRIGRAVHKNGEKNLVQTCHILHKKGNYAIMHFRELYALDGMNRHIGLDDIKRRNGIARLLEEWNLLKIINPPKDDADYSLDRVKILRHDFFGWNLKSNYTVGKGIKRETS